MQVGSSSTSFVMETECCEIVQYWAKSVIASPTITSLALGLATPVLETTAEECLPWPCPATTPSYPSWENGPWIHCFFMLFLWIQGPMDCQTFPSIAPASLGLTASPPSEAMALLLWALHGHHCLVGLPSFGQCLHWTYYTQPHTKKTEDLCGIWGRDSCNGGMDQPMARACVSCSEQWKVRDQNKNLCPFHWGMWLFIFLCSREVWTRGRGVSLWCDATPEGVTVLGQRACPGPSHISHMPQPVQGGRETSRSGCFTRATEQTHVIQPQPLLSPTAPLMKGPLFAHSSNPCMLIWQL